MRGQIPLEGVSRPVVEEEEKKKGWRRRKKWVGLLQAPSVLVNTWGMERKDNWRER